MKITKSELKQIIKEELQTLMNEEGPDLRVLEMECRQGNAAACAELGQLQQDALREEAEDEKWIQGAEKDIEKRGTEGVCTGDKFGGPTCRPGTKRYNLAKTFRKMAKDRKKK